MLEQQHTANPGSFGVVLLSTQQQAAVIPSTASSFQLHITNGQSPRAGIVSSSGDYQLKHHVNIFKVVKPRDLLLLTSPRTQRSGCGE